MKDRFKFRYVFEKDFGGRTGLCYKMPIFNLDNPTEFSAEVIVGETFCNLIMEYEKSGYKLKAKQQCTGLKDKNGKLIFEGDLIKINDEVFVVIYWRGEFTAESLNTLVKQEERQHFNWYNFCYPNNQPIIPEVIGNIYENPKLLKCG